MTDHSAHYLHYLLWLAVKDSALWKQKQSKPDFDIETERREGWGYDYAI